MESTVANPIESKLKVYVIRLKPNNDLKKELESFIKLHNLNSAFIMTCVGSLTKATLRLAYTEEIGAERFKTLEGHYEIVSLVGTLSANGGNHLHISLSDKNGNCFGGHVFGEMIVFTTAEIVIGVCQDLVFDRPLDPDTGFDELKIFAKS